MKVVALISGGKDSCFNILQCVAAGHEIVALANLLPESNLRDELDSYMYQTVGHRGVELYSEAMGLPLFRQRTSGRAIARDKLYAATPNDEVEDLYQLLAKVKEQVDIEAVAVGAVLSDYQRIRVENVCGRLGLCSLAYLWRRDQSELLREMVACRVDAVIIKVASLGLRPDEHLGRRIQSLLPHLERMNEKYGLNVCGEGGEYETFTLDCPLFAKAIVIDDYETVVHSNDAFAPVGYVNFLGPRLVDKQLAEGSTYNDRLVGFPVKTPLDYITDIDKEEFADEDAEQGTNNSSEETSMVHLESKSDDGGGGLGGVVGSSTDTCGNKWCWVGGVVGAGPDSGTATASALATVCKLLEQEGLACKDLVRVWMFVRDMADYPAINEAYVRVIEQTEPPVRVCVEAPLPSRFPIVIEATACAASGDRNTMHVQSISHWAPANIGPYSQAVRIGDIIYVAGQIPLVPGSMQLVEGEFRRHCRLALRHVDRVIRAMDTDTQIRDVVQGVCYVTNSVHVAEARREWERCSHDAITDFVVVPALPRGALVEWQVWAHRRNGRFEYEETGRTVGTCSVSLRRRWNHDNTVAALVCNVAGEGEGQLLSEAELEEVLLYAMQRLHRGSESEPTKSGTCALRLLRCVGRGPSSAIVLSVLARLPYDTVQTVVPVCQLGRHDTFISLWGLRH